MAWFFPLFEKIYDGEMILTDFSNNGEVYNTVVVVYNTGSMMASLAANIPSFITNGSFTGALFA